MASEVTRYSSDGQWRIDVEAWRNNFIIYSSIGTQVTVYRRSGTNIWGSASWTQSAALHISIRNSYNDGLAFEEGYWSGQSQAELKRNAFGLAISFPPPRPGMPDLNLNSVEGIVSVVLQNEESFEIRVYASSILSDNSIW